MLKKTLAILILAGSLTAGYAQSKKAAIGFLSSLRPEITYYGMYPSAPPNTPRSFFTNGTTFTDQVLFDSIKTKISHVLPSLGFRLIPEDSVITKDTYKELITKNAAGKTPNDIIAKGYAYPANFALLFHNDGQDPDVMIEANGYFELDFSNPPKGMAARLIYKMTIVGYDSKKKKVFVFKTKNNGPKDNKIYVTIKPSPTAGYSGYEIAEDISQKQMECLTDAFKQIDADLPEQLEKVTKYYSK